MIYFKAAWLHSDLRDPAWFFSELDADRWETRKVEIFLDGSMRWADESTGDYGEIRLGEKPVPEVDDINADPEFKAEEISREEFERVWNEATRVP